MSRRILIAWVALVLLLVGAALWFVRAAEPEPAVVSASVPDPGRGTEAPLVAEPSAPISQRVAEGTSSLEPLLVRVVDGSGVAPATWWVRAGPGGSEQDAEAPLVRSAPVLRSAARPAASIPQLEHELHGSGDVAVEVPADLRARVPRLVLQANAWCGPEVGLLQGDPFVVEPTTRGPIVLVAIGATRLVVRVEGPRPSGDLRYEIAPAAPVPAGKSRGAEHAVTSAGGASFVVVPEVPYRVRVTGTRPDDVVEAAAAGVALGARELLVVRFPGGFADPLPPGYAELALSGRIEFEGDDRPGLWASVDGGLPISIPVRADGSFELMHERAQTVELHASGGDLEPRFDPEVSTHPFGTRDVLVRGLPVAPTVPVRLRFVAAEDGAALPDAWVTFLVRDGERTRSRSLGGQSGTEVEVSLPTLEGLEYFVCARDRRDERGFLFASGAPAQGAVLERTIRLARGFRRDFRVVHCSLQTPVAGAEVALDARFLARSDADGRLRIELEEWPGRLTIRAEGFDEGQWPPAWQTPLASTTMTICPAD